MRLYGIRSGKNKPAAFLARSYMFYSRKSRNSSKKQVERQCSSTLAITKRKADPVRVYSSISPCVKTEKSFWISLNQTPEAFVCAKCYEKVNNKMLKICPKCSSVMTEKSEIEQSIIKSPKKNTSGEVIFIFLIFALILLIIFLL